MKISRLHILTQEHNLFSHAELAERACKAGADWIQFRDKSEDENSVWTRLCEVKEVCSKYNATLIVNDRVSFAKSIKADGVHLGKSDMNITEARKYLGNDFIIG